MTRKLFLLLALVLASCSGESEPERAMTAEEPAAISAVPQADSPGDLTVPDAAMQGLPAQAVAPPLRPAEGLTPDEQADFEAGLPPIRTGPMASQISPAWQDAELAEERQMQLSLPTANHPVWDVLRRTRVWIDEASQMFRASHPAEVRRLAGTRVTIRGYMLPLEPDMRTRHFLISPYTPVCFFHPPAEPNEVIEVRLSRPIEAGYHLVEVTGTFRLSNDGEKGLFFVIDGGSARIIERIEG
ncbi:MAG: DUF3299 domain-containing protein [Brevundimonas sp.]|uniref:DUF3299 domain-containing protein n=1 Tax=Brevundimonas sp. TaxID=1871086 RepID=UPI0027346708|nr:DUF3299 domain-containing protein [Brevundimonas sp.]MDP3379607.1 DUF3299 domain-containing protein [Brevundimonas sp.]